MEVATEDEKREVPKCEGRPGEDPESASAAQKSEQERREGAAEEDQKRQ